MSDFPELQQKVADARAAYMTATEHSHKVSRPVGVDEEVPADMRAAWDAQDKAHREMRQAENELRETRYQRARSVHKPLEEAARLAWVHVSAKADSISSGVGGRTYRFGEFEKAVADAKAAAEAAHEAYVEVRRWEW